MNAITHVKLVILSLGLMFLNQVNAFAPQSILDMKIPQDGIYRVYYSDVLNLGIDLAGIEVNQLALTSNGRLIPLKIVTDNQTTIGPNSYIEFVGNGQESLYQQGVIYSLVFGNNLGIIEQTQVANNASLVESSYLHTEVYNDNNAYSFGSPIDDPWFSKRILAIGSLKTANLDFSINRGVDVGTATIEIDIWGGTDYEQYNDHHVIYELDGTRIDDFKFDGIVSQSRQYDIPSFKLTNGSHQLTIKVPNDTNTAADVIHVESWKVTYPRSFSLQNNQLTFAYGDVNQAVPSEEIFKASFEDSEQLAETDKSASASNATVYYHVENATNSQYVVYKRDLLGRVKSIIVTAIGTCTSTPSPNCFLDFNTDNSAGFVYIQAESSVLTPELKVPVLQSNINQGFAQYIIISHPDFIGADLATFVQATQQNFSVKVVDVEQIYAQYSFGNVSADSIAQYIKHAYNKMGAKYILLVGGDTYDYKNYLGIGSLSFIPTLYGKTDEFIYYAPIDAKFADVDNDNVPDLNIGRFPVRSEAELTNLIQKINAYKNKTYSNTSVFAADEFDSSNNYSFKNDANSLISLLPQNWQNNITIDDKAYVDDDGVALAKSKITNNINQGVALTSFIGHSGPRDWSFSRMFSTSDALLLSNSTNPTLVTQWGCWNTYFVSPTEDTLAHAFMLNQNGGAASVLGASTLTVAEHEKGLANLVLVYLTRDEMTLGDAVTEAKRVYAQENPAALDVILGWNILGDPSLKL